MLERGLIVYVSLHVFGVQDSMTAAYPKVEDEGPHTFRRTHMELFI